VLIDASEVLLPMGYFRARQLLETAWALAQFGMPVTKHWSEVCACVWRLSSRRHLCCLRIVWLQQSAGHSLPCMI
jgi:hypothetical protein